MISKTIYNKNLRIKKNINSFVIITFIFIAAGYLLRSTRKIAKDRADDEGLVINPDSITDMPVDGEVTYPQRDRSGIAPLPDNGRGLRLL